MTDAHISAPEARRRQLVIQELADEVLIYDLDANRALCLNGAAAFVWRSCDGQNSVAQIARLLSKRLKTSIDETVVRFALAELEAEDLLENPVAAPVAAHLMNRRRIIGTLGKSAAVALPVIVAITAPAPASAASASCLANGASCPQTSACCSNTCQGGSCCVPSGASCSTSGDCCGSLVCVSGRCATSGGGGCVLYETPITGADGRKVKAVDVFVGQELLGIDCINGEKIAGRVKNLRKSAAHGFYSLTTTSGDTVNCSASHPLINGFGDRWGKRAELFKTGDALLIYDENSRCVVEAKTVRVERVDVPQPVVIFEMDTQEHTFISGGIVSHNVKVF